jgi:hypothetical protein
LSCSCTAIGCSDNTACCVDQNGCNSGQTATCNYEGNGCLNCCCV